MGINDSPDFEGFGAGAVDLYKGLEDDNSREYWDAHRSVYESDVAAPLNALATFLEPAFGQAKIFRPNRDVRFSKDKSPYKSHAAMVIRPRSDGALYLQFSPEGLMVAGGHYQPARDQLERFRDLQDDGRVTKGLDRLLDELSEDGLPLDDGAPLKTAPRGRSVDHPRITMLRRTMLTVGRTDPIAKWMFEASAAERIADTFASIDRWNVWLHDHVGPARAPVREG